MATSLSLASLTVTPAFGQTAPASPTPDAIKKAQESMKKGVTLYKSKRYNEAIIEFRASYASVPSPNSRFQIARALVALDEPVEAYLEYDGVIEDATARASEGKYAETLEYAVAERDQLAGKVALVTVTVASPEAAKSLLIGGREVPRARWGQPFPAVPGPIDVELSSTAGAPLREEFTLAAGEKKELTLDPAPAAPVDQGVVIETRVPESRRALRPYAYAAGGVGVAGLALFTVAGLMASSTYADLSETCGGRCPPNRQSDVDAGKTQQTLANIGLIVGAAGLAAGATLFVLSITGSEASDAAQTSAGRPQLLLGPGYAGVRGTF
ncbi:tetratricopeptide repeat protein [Chondromyces crocatus]|uniref:tetratricopeptide repeat protein n=1 Tax=Chondromyces crocatus TaxID=52 RepID=UPI001FE175F3|nr:tetratricopeptide repeat protein [Chondromyces crocatus]